MRISWKSVHLFFHNITNKHGSRKYKNRSRIQGVKCNILKMFQIVHGLISVVCWKYHENPFNGFPVVLLTGADSPGKVKDIPVLKVLNGTSWKCSSLLLVPSPIYPENFRKILPAVFPRNVVNRQIDKQTNERAIGDCILAKICYYNAHCNGDSENWSIVDYIDVWLVWKSIGLHVLADDANALYPLFTHSTCLVTWWPSY